MQITNSNLQKYNVNYGGYFRLFFPEAQYSSNVVIGDPYNHHIGNKIDIECTAKDFSDKITYFHPNCHLKSTINSFFTKQELQYPQYELNINSTTQNEFELKRLLRNDIYTSRVKFMEKISKIPEVYEQNLSYFTQKVEELKGYHLQVDDYLKEMQEKFTQLLKEDNMHLSYKETSLLKDRLKSVEKSIVANQKIKEFEQKLLY